MNRAVENNPKRVLVFWVGDNGESFISSKISQPISTSPVIDARKQIPPPAIIPPITCPEWFTGPPFEKSLKKFNHSHVIIEDSERSILQRFCVAVHNQHVSTLLGMAGGWGVLPESDK
jgi:hypothetical protein